MPIAALRAGEPATLEPGAPEPAAQLERQDVRDAFSPPANASGAGTAYAQLAETLTDRVDLSVLIQYYNTPSSFHHLAIRPIVRGYRRCAAAGNLSLEILVNVDSRAHNGGDVSLWLRELGPSDYMLLSPDVHELRAYNRLAAISRGTHLLLAQDDEAPNPHAPLWPGYDTCWWLRNASALLAAHDDIGVVGLQEVAIHHVRPHRPRRRAAPSAAEGASAPPSPCPEYAEAEVPRCVDPLSGTRTEGVLCAPAGPLLVRRSAFVAVRGFDERQVARGVLGAILVDCELQARLWLAGWATVYLSRFGIGGPGGRDSNRNNMKFNLDIELIRLGDGARRRPLAEEAVAGSDVPTAVRKVFPHLAWRKPRACAIVAAAAERYNEHYQRVGRATYAQLLGAVRHFNRRRLDCSAASRARASSNPPGSYAPAPAAAAAGGVQASGARAAGAAAGAAGVAMASEFPIGPIDCGLPPELQSWWHARRARGAGGAPPLPNASDAGGGGEAARAWAAAEEEGGACAPVALAAAILDSGTADSLASRRGRACADGGCALPWTSPSELPALSVLVQYFNAPDRAHHLAIAPLVTSYKRCAAAANLSLEILVNVDSRAHNGGDVSLWLRELGPSDYVLLSPDVHELRAYNRLAAISRGTHLLLAQDDDGVPGSCGCERSNTHCLATGGDARGPQRARQLWPPQPDDPSAARRVLSASWLAGAIALLRSPLAASNAIKLVSFNSILFYLPSLPLDGLRSGARGERAESEARLLAALGLARGALGPDSLRDSKNQAMQPRCSITVLARAAEASAAGGNGSAPGREVNVPIEMAVEAARCADMGPLLVERSAFLAVGGYNESMAARGEAGSVAVDCELQARLWLRGIASVALAPRSADGASAWARAFQTPGVARHVAWRQQGMGRAHERRVHEYGRRFQAAGSAEVARISRRVLATNRLFQCPSADGWVPHAPLDCLIHSVHPACALVGARPLGALAAAG